MRKKHPEHVNLERWLVSYADFMTLLFALFVVMYASAQADKSKLDAAAKSIRDAFGPSSMIDMKGSSGGNTINQFESQEIPGGRLVDLPAGKTNVQADDDGQLHEVKDLLEESVSLELGVTDPSEKLVMEFDRRGLILRIAAKNFFAPGEVEVAQDLRPILDRIAQVLLRINRVIRIEGHTDAAETQVKGYPSDWELSAARAAWVARYWQKRFDFGPRRLGIAGYSHTRPLSKEFSVWGKGANRRVEIIVLSNRYEKL